MDTEAALIPLHQGWRTAWLVSVAADADDDNPYAGWNTIHADAHTATVELDGQELTAGEARNMGLAFLQAAEHAEHYHQHAAAVLSDEQARFALRQACLQDSDSPQLWPAEQRRAVNTMLAEAQRHAHRRGPGRGR